MTYEESKSIWQVEKSSDFVPEEGVSKEVYDLIDELIENDIIRYDEYCEAVVKTFISLPTPEENTKENRRKHIEQVYTEVLKHFKKIKDERISKE